MPLYGELEGIMKKAFGITFGILLVAAGVVYSLDTLGITSLNISFDGWWTLFIIIPSVSALITDRDKTGGIIGLATGVLLLLAARDIIAYDIVLRLLLTVLAILLGIKLIVKSIRPTKKPSFEEPRGENAHFSAFTSEKNDFNGKDVNKAKIGAVFGGSVCNLIGAKIENGSQLDMFCMFGGVDIIVPENVNVNVNTFCLFGGVSDKRAVKNTPDNPVTLTINGCCIFGGADIKDTHTE